MNMMQLLGLMGTIVLIHVGLGVLAEIGEKKEKERKQCGCDHHHDADGDPECHCGGNCKCKNNDEE
jgi:hypothetical protein